MVEVFGVGDALCRLLGADAGGHVIVVDKPCLCCRPLLFHVLCGVVTRLRVGQTDHDGKSLAFLAFSVHLALMQLHERLDDGQTYACAAFCSSSLIESLEEARQFLLRHTLSRVAHLDGVCMVGVCQGYVDASSLWCILEGVGHQIEEDVRNLVAVCNDDRILLHC